MVRAMVPVQRQVRVLNPTPLAVHIGRAGGATIVALAVGVAAFIGALSGVTAIVAAAGALAYATWAIAGLWARFRNRTLSSVRVDERGLYLRDRLRFERAAIKSVEWAPTSGAGGAAALRIIGRFRMTTLECTSEDDARALVDALRFAPGDQSASFSFLPAMAAPKLWAVMAIFAGLCGLPVFFSVDMPSGASFATIMAIRTLPNIGCALIVGLLGGLLLRRLRIAVDVGLDGIRVRRGASDRFVPFHEIEWVRPTGSKVLSFKARGEAEWRWFSFIGFGGFVHRIEEAQRLVSSQSEGAGQAVLAAPTAAVADYRQPDYPNAVLLRVVEDGSQPVMARTNAADALRYRLEPEERERVRRVAATTASADLRHHFEELAASDAGAEHLEAERRRSIAPRDERLK
jgi:hypothetical protein